MPQLHPPKNIILPAIIGNIMEWYDFTLYAYFSVVFATLYFPADDKFLSLLLSYGLLAISYFMRPLGALVFGYFGDKFGRKYSLSYSILIMGGCSFLVSILPTYADWGVMAGIFLVIIRLIQGFAVGGESSGATVYLIESASPGKRTFFGSIALASTYSGFLLSSAVGAGLSFILAPEILSTWGWRIAFALGGVIALIGLYIRRRLPDTQEYQEDKKKLSRPYNPVKDLFKDHSITLLFALGLGVMPAGFSYLIFVFMVGFLQVEGGYSVHAMFVISTWMMLFVVIITPLIGFFADKIGRRKIMLIATLLIIVFCIPIFKLTLQHALLGLLLLTFLNMLFEANIPTEVAELFPAHCRYTGVALTLNLTNGVAGGLAPIIGWMLFHNTGIMISPMFYILGLCLITLITFFCSTNV